ncbi:MAG: molybdopterin-dependent oxidoreductase [Thaumarchaeota archaeon]|nr:molybdopterin-dependent oxidoreductase [Nitrososphaerota archaeon]
MTEENGGQTRRDFLKLAATVPLVSYLTTLGRATAIEKEAAPEAYVKEVKTICTFCAVGCGIIAKVRGDGKVVFEGDPDHPINRGSLCPKGLAGAQLLNNPRRLRAPLMRTNPNKGIEEDPGWVEISWSEAFERIADWMKEAVDGEIERLKSMRVKIASDEEPTYHLRPSASRKEEKYFFDGHEFPIGCIGSAVYNNEEAYLNRKLWTILGSNNVEHCARKCHASTVGALAPSFGFGAMTNHFIDMRYSKCIIHEGGSPATAHPIAYKWIEEAKERGAKVIVVDPRYNRTASQADIYARIRPGTDAAFFLGITKYAIDHGYHDVSFLKANTNAPCLLRVDKYPYELYMVKSESDVDWTGEENLWKGVNTYAVCTSEGIKPWVEVDPKDRVLEPDGRITSPEGYELKTVYQVLKEVLENYTPEEVSKITGVPVEKFLEVAETFCTNKPGTVTYAMGLTQHTNGVQLLRSLCVMQLVLGNMGRPGGGINAIRGQNNVQGATDMLVLCHLFPGYIPIPKSEMEIREHQFWKNLGRPSDLSRYAVAYIDTKIPKDYELWNGSKLKKGDVVRKGERVPNPWYMNTLTTRKFSGWHRYEKAWGIFVGTFPINDPLDGAVISDLPFKPGHFIIDQDRAFGKGKIKVYFEIGDNGVVTDGGAASVYKEFTKAPGRLIVADIWMTETAHLADLVLPMACAYEKDGSVTNSPRWVQWRSKVVDPPGVAKSDLWLFVNLYKSMRQKGVLKLPSERFIEDHKDLIDPVTGRKLGEQGYLECLPDEIWGPRPCPDRNWGWYDERAPEQVYAEMDDAVGLYDGQYAHPGYKYAIEAYRNGEGYILAKRRLNVLRSGIDFEWTMYKNWGWCWPKNVRVLYNKDDCGENDEMKPVTFKTDNGKPYGKPLPYPACRVDSFPYWRKGNTFFWGKDRSGLAHLWDQGLANKTASSVKVAESAGLNVKGRKLKGPNGYPVGGIPEHGEPMESPDAELMADYPCQGYLYIGANDYEGNDKLLAWERVGSPDEYPCILTTFRLTEHFHTFTRNLPWLNELQPELFVEMNPGLANEIGVKTGDIVAIESKRGRILAKAYVTERIGFYKDSKGIKHWFVAMPFHWGYKGISIGSITNFLTIGAVDPFVKIPETKVALVRVEKAKPDEVEEFLKNGFYMKAKVG